MEIPKVGPHMSNLHGILKRREDENSFSAKKSLATSVKMMAALGVSGFGGFGGAIFAKIAIDAANGAKTWKDDRKVLIKASDAMMCKVYCEINQNGKMTDATKLELKDMIEIMKKIRKLAHPTQRVVAGTIGRIPGAAAVASLAGGTTVGFNDSPEYIAKLQNLLPKENDGSSPEIEMTALSSSQ